MTDFQFGIARKIITPPLGGHLFGYHPNIISEEKHDDLTATACCFQDRKNCVMMISLTLCSLDTGLCRDFCEEIQKETGIPADHVQISAIHTHCGPPLINSPGWGEIDMDYVNNILRPNVIAAAKEAKERLKPAEMGYAFGESLVGINRRENKPEGGVKLGQDPLGPMDRIMRVVSFRDIQGNPIGNMVFYSAHCTAAGPIPVITRDWAGILCDGLEEESGAITAYFNGTIGDCGPRLTNGKTTGNIPLMEELGCIAAQDAIRIYNSISRWEAVTVSAVRSPYSLPKKPRIPYEIAFERYQAAKAEAKANMSCKIAEHYRKIVSSYEKGEKDAKEFSAHLSVIRIGKLAFVGLNNEVFTEIGKKIRRSVSDLTVVTLSLSGGASHYFPTENEIGRGGYEILNYHHSHAQHYVDGAPDLLIEKAVAIINSVERS